MNIISRKDAKNQGLKYYFTGTPCKRGHIAIRVVSSYCCTECAKEFNQQEDQKEKKKIRYQENREKVLQKVKIRAEENREEIKEYQKLYREENREKNKEYQKEYYLEHQEEAKAFTRKQREENPEYHKEYGKKYREENKEKISESNKRNYQSKKEEKRAQKRDYYQRNKIDVITRNKKRKKRIRRATPPWYDHKDIKPFYEEAIRLTEETGIPHHVDHIVPLKNYLVCGLHCKDNLQVLTAEENMSKGNNYLID